jgi:hypothetical protein
MQFLFFFLQCTFYFLLKYKICFFLLQCIFFYYNAIFFFFTIILFFVFKQYENNKYKIYRYLNLHMTSSINLPKCLFIESGDLQI